MSGVDTRHINRDSLFLLAEVQPEGAPASQRVKVRNLSAGGMMAEGDLTVVRGGRVRVTLRNLPPVDGNVAWIQDNRFGIAFEQEVDPKAPRTAVAASDLSSPRFTRSATIAPPISQRADTGLRKI